MVLYAIRAHSIVLPLQMRRTPLSCPRSRDEGRDALRELTRPAHFVQKTIADDFSASLAACLASIDLR